MSVIRRVITPVENGIKTHSNPVSVSATFSITDREGQKENAILYAADKSYREVILIDHFHCQLI